MADITVTGTMYKSKDGTKRGIKVKVCNQTDHDIDIKLADNPWSKPVNPDAGNLGPKKYDIRKENGEADTNAQRKKALENFKNPNGGNGPWTLKKKGAKGDCQEFDIPYDSEPAAVYCDVYIMKPDGTPRDDYADHYTRVWDPVVETAYIGPKGPHPQYACVYYLPYPMSLGAVWNGDIEVAIDRVEGLPKGFEIVHAYPAIHAAHHLDAADRESHAVIFVRQMQPFSGRFTIQVYYRIVSPAHLTTWPERSIGFDIVARNGLAPFQRGSEKVGPKPKIGPIPKVAPSPKLPSRTSIEKVKKNPNTTTKKLEARKK
jgi:hypothetical protein